MNEETWSKVKDELKEDCKEETESDDEDEQKIPVVTKAPKISKIGPFFPGPVFAGDNIEACMLEFTEGTRFRVICRSTGTPRTIISHEVFESTKGTPSVFFRLPKELPKGTYDICAISGEHESKRYTFDVQSLAGSNASAAPAEPLPKRARTDH